MVDKISWREIHSIPSRRIGVGGPGREANFHTESLSREGFLYKVIPNGFRSQSGQPLESMNLDEILENGLPPEGESFGSSSGRSIQETSEQEIADRKMTAGEMWTEMRSEPQRQPSTGAMTLEDFLVKEGIMRNENARGPRNVSSTVSTVPVFAGGCNWRQASTGAADYYSAPGELSYTLAIGNGLVISDDQEDQMVERRQKRMMKNRESAARSRARKLAYTHELENKISRLEEENKRLKKQRDFEKILDSLPDPQPRICLRRTSTAPF